MQKNLDLYPVQVCDGCGDEYYEHELEVIHTTNSSGDYCPICINTMFFTCHRCEEQAEIINSKTIDGNMYCGECIESSFTVCYSCGTITLNGEMASYGDECYCQECYDSEFRICDECGETHPYDNIRYPNGSWSCYCISCFDDLFRTCQDCGRAVRVEELHNGDYCDDCIESNESEDDESIHNYSYKPNPVFFGKSGENLHLGLELEVENVNEGHKRYESDNIAEMVSNELFYCKYDGSIDCGFEVVSHPMSYGYITGKGKSGITKMLDTLRNNGMRSYQTETCGMHVHLSKKAIGNLTLYKILKLFYENKKFILKISNRKSSKLNEYASLGDEPEGRSGRMHRYEKAKYKNTGERFLAINLENRQTLEIRIFRGTLKEKSFLKNIEFCHSIVIYSKETSIRDIELGTYRNFIYKNRKVYPNMYKWFSDIKWESSKNLNIALG